LFRHLDYDDPRPFCGELMIILGQEVVEQVGKCSRCFDTGGTRADDYEGKFAILNQTWVAIGGFESVQDLVAELDRIRQRVEGKGMLGGAGSIEVINRSAPSQHQIVVSDLVAILQMDCAAGNVNAGHR